MSCPVRMLGTSTITTLLRGSEFCVTLLYTPSYVYPRYNRISLQGAQFGVMAMHARGDGVHIMLSKRYHIPPNPSFLVNLDNMTGQVSSLSIFRGTV